MTITYSWALTGLKATSSGDLAGTVVQTYWTCTGTDTEGNEGVFSGATPFDPSTVDPDTFTALSDLSEEQVLGWVKAEVTGSYWDHVAAQIDKQLEAKRVRIEDMSAEDFPWAAKA